MSMRKGIIIGIVVIALLSGGAFASHVLASGNQQPDVRGLAGVKPGELILQQKAGEGNWEETIGDLALGYSVALDPGIDFYYLDIKTLNADPALADGLYAFFFDHIRAPEAFWTYWAGQGVSEGATGWSGIMWEIINGQEPMFYLKVVGSSYQLVDGLQYLNIGVENPLRISGDYPLATYHYGGWVEDVEEGEEYLNIQMTFTREAGVSLTADHWTIDGCGYLDVYIHLENVYDLYAVDVALEFDKDVLEVVDLLPVNGINLEPVDDWFVAGHWAKNEADNAAGTIRYAATQLRGADPVQGAGDIAKIRFRAKALADATPITITKAEFSDRDGFLVGRPAGYEVPAATITTQFTAAAGLDLDIIRKDASTVQLQWQKPGEDSGIVGYTLHKSKLPYFELGDTDVEKITAGFDVTDDLITFNDAVLGDVVDNWFYALQVACEHDYESPLSWQVGKFEFELFETPTTDFSMIGLIFDNPNLVKAQDLGNHIKNNLFTGSVDVLTISRWNPVGQTFTSYVYSTGAAGFDIFTKQAYRVEINIAGITSGSVIWAQVGKVPEITPETYTLYKTASTDFNWILQPLDMVTITNTTQLAETIEANANGEVDVLSIARWNHVGQSFTSYIRPGSSTTRFGYPYRVEVDVKDGNTVIWPDN